LGLPNEQSIKRPFASLTGATYLYQFIEAADKNLVELNTNFYFTNAETRAFRGRQKWMPGGLKSDVQGLQYLLATQLGCSQPEGNTVPEMLSYLKRSAAADGARPEGTFFYMKNRRGGTQQYDIRSSARHDGFPAAVAQLRNLKLKAEMLDGVTPPAQNAILGLTTGAIYVNLVTSGSKLAPGALVDNLTSSGGVLTRVANPKPQTRISEYLRQGAAGASGTVIEPFAVAPKFPSPSLHVHYARGATMAEAFYQSVGAPFQLLILGDPLCRPWAYIPEVTVTGVAEGAMVSGTFEMAPAANLPPDRSVNRFQLYVDGRPRGLRGPEQTFQLDTTQLGDGYHELRVIAVDDTPVETQGSWIGGVIVKNGRDAVTLSAPRGPRVSGSTVSLAVNSTVDGVMDAQHPHGQAGPRSSCADCTHRGGQAADEPAAVAGSALSCGVGGPRRWRSRACV
jgi:hypothetical protein